MIKLATKTTFLFLSFLSIAMIFKGYIEENVNLEKQKVIQLAEKERMINEAKLSALPPLERSQEALKEILLKEFKDNLKNEIKINWIKENNSYTVNISLEIKASLLDGSSNNRALIKSAHLISKELVYNKHLQNISFLTLSNYRFGMNKYGNEASSLTGKIQIDKNEITKINWKNMDIHLFENFLKSSDAIWIN